jgi:serine-type D-Ala-D-Ala carboxypeptidase/endopeptidase
MRLILLLATLLATACSGARPAPGACSHAEGPGAQVCAQLDEERWDDLSVIVGDRDGQRLVYSRGGGPDTVYRIASASKLLSSVTILRLVDRGLLSLEDHPQRLIDWWPSAPDDPRSQVTLRQLLSFTAGYDLGSLASGCVRDDDITLDACARELADEHFAYTPGSTYHYGPAHMHLAALMAERATGKRWDVIFREELGDPLKMGPDTGFPDTQNPDPAGSASASGADYAAFMLALARGELLTPASQAALLSDQSERAEIGYSPVTAHGWEWHYGLGCWKECAQEQWSAACDAGTIYSSPGAFGFYPWIDAATGRWGVLAIQRGFMRRPSRDSVRAIWRVRPALDALFATAR